MQELLLLLSFNHTAVLPALSCFTTGGRFFLLANKGPTMFLSLPSRTKSDLANYKNYLSTQFAGVQGDVLTVLLQFLQFCLYLQPHTSCMPSPVYMRKDQTYPELESQS
jgi:hypothetical protein